MQATASPLAEQGPHHSGPFAAVAHDLRRRGLCVIPTPGDDGKTPEGGYAFKIWKHPPGEKFVDEMIRAHGNDNLGIITGLSKFKPPSSTSTTKTSASSSTWSAASATRRWRRLRHRAECTSGIASMASAPSICALPRKSRSRSRPRPAGSWCWCRRPTGAAPASLTCSCKAPGTTCSACRPSSRAGALSPAEPPRPRALPTPLTAVREVVRNDTLTRCLASHLARRLTVVDTEADLIAIASHFNATYCDPPDHDAKVVKTARQIWRYKLEGRIWELGGEAHVQTSRSTFDRLKVNADAWVLDTQLRFRPWRPRRTFRHCPRSHGRTAGHSGLGWRRYRNARAVLLDLGCLEQVRQGGRRNTTRTYTGSSSARESRGTNLVGNISKNTPGAGRGGVTVLRRWKRSSLALSQRKNHHQTQAEGCSSMPSLATSPT